MLLRNKKKWISQPLTYETLVKHVTINIWEWNNYGRLKTKLFDSIYEKFLKAGGMAQVQEPLPSKCEALC
jgi:hypothetical protein